MQLLDFQTQVRPDRFADEGAKHLGLVDLSQLPRFAAEVQSSKPLEAQIQYGRDEEGVFIDASLSTHCELLCQFCLSSFVYLLQSSNRFRPVFTLEAAREISDDCEPILYEDGMINIINMIEDDALLAIPNYPQCNDCKHDNMGDTFPSQFAIIANSDLVPEND